MYGHFTRIERFESEPIQKYWFGSGSGFMLKYLLGLFSYNCGSRFVYRSYLRLDRLSKYPNIIVCIRYI